LTLNARLPTLLVAILAVTGLAAGCGGSSDADEGGASTTVTASSLSKAAFIKQANAICERERSLIINSKVPLPKAAATVYVPAFESIVVDVQDLGAPRGDEAEVEAFLGAMQEDTETLEERSSSIKTFAEIEGPFKDSAALAKKYGLSLCVFYARFPA
jgi:hypothetical protein